VNAIGRRTLRAEASGQNLCVGGCATLKVARSRCLSLRVPCSERRYHAVQDCREPFQTHPPKGLVASRFRLLNFPKILEYSGRGQTPRSLADNSGGSALVFRLLASSYESLWFCWVAAELRERNSHSAASCLRFHAHSSGVCLSAVSVGWMAGRPFLDSSFAQVRVARAGRRRWVIVWAGRLLLPSPRAAPSQRSLAGLGNCWTVVASTSSP
jgi:hypothetical protein